jgi:hypothetical protein
MMLTPRGGAEMDEMLLPTLNHKNFQSPWRLLSRSRLLSHSRLLNRRKSLNHSRLLSLKRLLNRSRLQNHRPIRPSPKKTVVPSQPTFAIRATTLRLKLSVDSRRLAGLA